jgi:outer membrane protein OmpA-like peptidoglycan-associated protein
MNVTKKEKQNNSAAGDDTAYNRQKRGTRYLLWLFVAVIIISIFSLITTAYSKGHNMQVLLDSINSCNTVYFDYGKSALKEVALDVIDKIADEMKNNGNTGLFITGYTDDRGSEPFNNILSLERANAVKEYLISKGIKAECLIVKAMGKSDPLNDNATEEERAANRRVVFSYTDPERNTGKYAIDNFPDRRFYAEPTLKNEYVNSSFRVRSREELTADLSIRDSAGQPVDSVKAEDITAVLRWDNNGATDSAEGTPRLIPINDKKKIAFTLTMDYSGSMYGVETREKDIPKSDKIIAMEKSVELFIKQLGNNMYCKIIKFGEKVLPPLRFTKSKEVLLSALENNSFPMGGTALYSSIYIAMGDTAFQSNPTVMKTVIAFTDGMENSSVKVTLDSIYRRSSATSTKIFTIGLYNDVGTYKPNDDELRKRKVDMLSIAQNTGGFFYPANDPGELKRIYANILDQVLKSYSVSIVWNSSKLPPKGTQVKAELKINVKGTVRVMYKSYIME